MEPIKGFNGTLYVLSTEMLTMWTRFGSHPATEQTNSGRSSEKELLEQSVLSKAKLVAAVGS